MAVTYIEENKKLVACIPSAPIQNEAMLQSALLPVISNVVMKLFNFHYGLHHDICVIGKEITTTHGRIDILLQDISQGTLLPVELKMGTASTAIVEQVQRYSQDISDAFDSILQRGSVNFKDQQRDDIYSAWDYINHNPGHLTQPILIARDFDSRISLTYFNLIAWEYLDHCLYLQIVDLEVPSHPLNPLLDMALHDSLQSITEYLKATKIISSTFADWTRDGPEE